MFPLPPFSIGFWPCFLTHIWPPFLNRFYPPFLDHFCPPFLNHFCPPFFGRFFDPQKGVQTIKKGGSGQKFQISKKDVFFDPKDVETRAKGTPKTQKSENCEKTRKFFFYPPKTDFSNPIVSLSSHWKGGGVKIEKVKSVKVSTLNTNIIYSGIRNPGTDAFWRGGTPPSDFCPTGEHWMNR